MLLICVIAEYGEPRRKNSLPGLGQLLRNVGMRKSGRKFAYKQHEGRSHL